MSNHARIIENLEGRVHGVNAFVALSGTDMDFDALNDLIHAGRIRREHLRTPEGRGSFELFRLVPANVPHLTVV